MIRRFRGAVQFLTILPVRGSVAGPGESALLFPVIGALLGMFAGMLLVVLGRYAPLTVSSLLTLVFLVVITGGLHEDGLADTFDAFRTWRTPERIHAILKDSRIGAHGALALLLSVLLRWQALNWISVNPVVALGVALGISRAAMVVLIWITPPAGSGSAMHFSSALQSRSASLVAVQGIALAFVPGIGIGVLLLVCTILVVLLARRAFLSMTGGITGDCAGATGQIVETSCLLLFTCRSFTS